MTALPPSLRSWQAELGIFPPDLAATLGALVRRISVAFGASQRLPFDDGEPDGFDGLARRGSYERLLTSEWALRTLAPLEFLRRAAEGEHAFLKLARNKPSQRLGCVVLLDSGPPQLGSCRIVQLALLILLSERARHARARFGWQHLIRVGEPLHATIDEQSVRAFLLGRTGLEVGASAVGEWERRLAGHELWVVGSEAVTRCLHRDSSGVTLSERMDPALELVDVSVKAARARERSLVLELPPHDVATRLLRNPFETAVRVSLRMNERPTTNLVLNGTGSKLFFRRDDGRVSCVPVPSSPHAELKSSVLHAPAGMTIVAAGTRGKRIVWLAAESGVVVLRSQEPLRHGAKTELSCPGPSLSPSSVLWPLVVSTSPLCALLVAADRSLWRVDFDRQESIVVAEGVTALMPLGLDSAVVAAFKHRGGPAIVRVDPGSASVLPLGYSSGPVHLRLFLQRKEATLIAARSHGDGVWSIDRLPLTPTRKRSEVTLHPPAGERVVGVDATGESYANLGLYLLDAEGRSLSAVGRHHSRQLVRTNAPMTEIALAPGSGQIAYLSAGRIGFVRRGGGKHLPEFTP